MFFWNYYQVSSEKIIFLIPGNWKGQIKGKIVVIMAGTSSPPRSKERFHCLPSWVLPPLDSAPTIEEGVFLCHTFCPGIDFGE